jgi:thiol-disulfide isomerase/thioredoxin
MIARGLALLGLVVLLGCAGCAQRDRHDDITATAPSASPSSSAAPASPLVLAPASGIRWTQAPASTDVAGLVRASLTQARADGRRLLVYVGATWCEPCQRFHHAVDAGELDAAFPRLSIVGFDADRDGEALAAAGYRSRLIPLFALPGDDGRSSGKQIEGSVKGAAAVSEITPRLRALLDGT